SGSVLEPDDAARWLPNPFFAFPASFFLPERLSKKDGGSGSFPDAHPRKMAVREGRWRLGKRSGTSFKQDGDPGSFPSRHPSKKRVGEALGPSSWEEGARGGA